MRPNSERPVIITVVTPCDSCILRHNHLETPSKPTVSFVPRLQSKRLLMSLGGILQSVNDHSFCAATGEDAIPAGDSIVDYNARRKRVSMKGA